MQTSKNPRFAWCPRRVWFPCGFHVVSTRFPGQFLPPKTIHSPQKKKAAFRRGMQPCAKGGTRTPKVLPASTSICLSPSVESANSGFHAVFFPRERRWKPVLLSDGKIPWKWLVFGPISLAGSRREMSLSDSAYEPPRAVSHRTIYAARNFPVVASPPLPAPHQNRGH